MYRHVSSIASVTSLLALGQAKYYVWLKCDVQIHLMSKQAEATSAFLLFNPHQWSLVLDLHFILEWPSFETNGYRRDPIWLLSWYDRLVGYWNTTWSVLCYMSDKHVPSVWSLTTSTRVIQKVLLCTKYYVNSNAYPYLVYSNLLRKVSWTKAQFNQSRDLLSKRSRIVYLDACLRHWQV